MARLSRMVLPGTPPHVTQRGHRRHHRSVFTYDLMSRQTAQSDYNISGYAAANPGANVVFSRSATYAANGTLTGDTTSTLKYESDGYTTNTYVTQNTYALTSTTVLRQAQDDRVSIARWAVYRPIATRTRM